MGPTPSQRRKAALEDEPTRFSLSPETQDSVPDEGSPGLAPRQKNRRPRSTSSNPLEVLGSESVPAEDVLRDMDGILLQELLAACLERKVAVMLFRSKNDGALVAQLYFGDSKRTLLFPDAETANKVCESVARSMLQ